MIFEKHIPISVGTSPGLFTISTTSATYVEPAYPTYISFDPANYSAGTYYYEAVLKTDAATAYAQLYTSGGSAVSGTEISTTATSVTRIRSSSITLSSGEYVGRIKNNGTNTTTFYGDRIVIVQNSSAISNTETQVSLFYYTTASTTSTSYEDFGTIGNYFYYHTGGNWDGTITAYYEAVMKTSAATAYSQLFTAGDGNIPVDGGEITTTSTSFVRVRSGNVWGNLSTGKSYKGRFKNDGTNTTYVNSARIIIQQTNFPTKTECYLPSNINDVAHVATGGTFQDSLGRVYYDSSNWSGLSSITWYADYSMNSNVANGTLEMYALASAATVAGSSIATAIDITRGRSSALTMPASQNITTRGDSQSGTVYQPICYLLAVVAWVNNYYNNAKADILKLITTDNYTVASILTTRIKENYVKANIIAINDNRVIANIRAYFLKKRFAYKLYYSDTDVRDVWANEVLNDPSFRFTINGGPGEVTIRLARKIDAFGEGDDIVLNRKIDIYVYDRDAPNGRLLYRGFIAGFAPVLDGPREYLEITILGYVVEIGQRILKDGAGNTTIEYFSEDPSNIMKDILEKYKAEGGELDYTPTSIETTGTSVTYTFTCYSIKEALDKLIELTPYDWYWRIDPDCTVYLKQKSTTADHKLYIGKHIIYMQPQKRIEAVRNRLYFIGGTPPGEPQLYRRYSRTSSINTWGLREEKWTDQRVTRIDTADIKADRWLDEREEPEIRTVLRIADNNGENPDLGYDIESIKPGDTISIENLKTSKKVLTLWDQMIWEQSKWDFEVSYITADILHVISVTYHPDYLEIEAAKALPSVPKRIEDIQRNVDAMTTAELPVKPVEA